MRLRKIKNASEKLLKYEHLLIDINKLSNINWVQMFGNSNPIYLEIGMGKGQFIMNNALKNPNINYIGLEVFETVVLKAVHKINEQAPDITNLKIILADANNLLNYFSPQSISKIFLNFSDPWPKKKHEKRRLTCSDFLSKYKTILKEDADIEIKTDNQHFFEYTLKTLNEENLPILDLNLNLHDGVTPDIISTEYEDKFVSLNQPIYFVKTAFTKPNNITFSREAYIGSMNKVKVEAVKTVLAPYGFKVIANDVPSNVSLQPKSDEETIKGALNRAKSLPGDFRIGLEAGVVLLNDILFLVNWGSLIDENNNIYFAGGTRIPLPNDIKQAIFENGLELSDAMEKYFNKIDIKHNEGAIGYFTFMQVKRIDIFIHIVKLLYGQYLKAKEGINNENISI